jgi:hypothetical protein
MIMLGNPLEFRQPGCRRLLVDIVADVGAGTRLSRGGAAERTRYTSEAVYRPVREPHVLPVKASFRRSEISCSHDLSVSALLDDAIYLIGLLISTMGAPKTHKAIVYDRPGQISVKLVDVATPVPGRGEVLVKM